MSSLEKRIGWLQGPIGVLGFLAWMCSFPLSTWSREHEYLALADGVSGYVLGFASAFAGWIAVHLYKGRWANFVDPHPVLKWFSILMLVGVCLFGLAGTLIDRFADTSMIFKVGFWLSAFVMGACVGPAVNRFDGL